MRFPRRHFKARASRQSSGVTTVIPSQKADVWISRLASLSQFGLFVITIGGFYFTVLPLYQKALLEEAIARKEVELRSVSMALEESYSRVRDSAIKEFVFGVGANCSGMMLPPRNAELIGIHIPNRKPHAQEILEIEPRKCLIEAISKYPGLRNLRQDDMGTLREAVARIARELDERRSTLIADANSSWNTPTASRNANAYGEFVRSQVLTLRSIAWSR